MVDGIFFANGPGELLSECRLIRVKQPSPVSRSPFPLKTVNSATGLCTLRSFDNEGHVKLIRASGDEVATSEENKRRNEMV